MTFSLLLERISAKLAPLVNNRQNTTQFITKKMAKNEKNAICLNTEVFD